jgi:hypothetical protein
LFLKDEKQVIEMTNMSLMMPLGDRLRNAAIHAIKESGRPMAACEVEEWVSANTPNLAQELSTKCYDYVRIILSLSPYEVLAKYKPRLPREGLDHRCAFYGIHGARYDPQQWIQSDSKHRKRPINPPKREKRAQQPRKGRMHAPPPSSDESSPPSTPIEDEEPPSRQRVCLFSPAPVVPEFGEMDHGAVSKAWATLSCLLIPDDPFWGELQTAIRELQMEMDIGTSAHDGVSRVIRNHTKFLHPLVADDVAVILAKEAQEKEGEIASPPEFDSWYL